MAAAALLASEPSWAQDECNEFHDYVGYELYARIVVDSYGPNGPISPDLHDILRASVDMELIRQALGGVTHSPPWSHNIIYYETIAPDDPDLICTNIYYQANVIGSGPVYSAEFPETVNVAAMMEVYLALPAVQSVSMEGLGCTDHCCFHYALFEKLPDDTWRWSLVVPCFFFNSWCVHVSPTGEVTWCLPGDISPPGGDGVVGPDDLAELLYFWGTYGSQGPSADLSLPLDGQVGPADLAILLANWNS